MRYFYFGCPTTAVSNRPTLAPKLCQTMYVSWSKQQIFQIIFLIPYDSWPNLNDPVEKYREYEIGYCSIKGYFFSFVIQQQKRNWHTVPPLRGEKGRKNTSGFSFNSTHMLFSPERRRRHYQWNLCRIHTETLDSTVEVFVCTDSDRLGC